MGKDKKVPIIVNKVGEWVGIGDRKFGQPWRPQPNNSKKFGGPSKKSRSEETITPEQNTQEPFKFNTNEEFSFK